jgi:YVTN family beta-propeller protein
MAHITTHDVPTTDDQERTPRISRRRGVTGLALSLTLVSAGWAAGVPAAAAPSAANTYAVTAAVNFDDFGEPYGVAVDPGVRRAYVSLLQSGQVAVVDTKKNLLVGKLRVGEYPHAMAMAMDVSRHTAYVQNILSHTVSVIDTKRSEVVASIPVPQYPYALAVDPSTNTIYVSSNDDGSQLAVIDGYTREVTATFPLASVPSALAVHSATQTVYATTGEGVTVIDGRTNTVSGVIPTSSPASAISVDQETHTVYVANTGSDSVTVIDGATRTASKVVAVGDGPRAVTVDEVKDAVYVGGTRSLSVINSLTNAVVATVSVEGYTQALAVNPKTSAVYAAGAFNFGSGYGNGLSVMACINPKGPLRCS